MGRDGPNQAIPQMQAQFFIEALEIDRKKGRMLINAVENWKSWQATKPGFSTLDEVLEYRWRDGASEWGFARYYI